MKALAAYFLIFLTFHFVSCDVNDNSISQTKDKEDSLEEITTIIVSNKSSIESSTVPTKEEKIHDEEIENLEEEEEVHTGPIPCTCGVFLTGQFKKGSKDQPKGVPVLTNELENIFPNNAMGNRQCTNKCLEIIIKHLPKSNEIICATVDRDDVFKERAYLFIKNHGDKWIGTNLSAGREFCCKDHEPFKCPKK